MAKSKTKIFLADDQPAQIEYWQTELARLNLPDIEIDSAFTTKKVYQALEKNLYDLLLLDMDWSDGGGHEKEGIDILKAAKQANPNIEVIIITAKGPGTNFNRIRDAYELGVTDFLEKGTGDYYQAEFERVIRNAREKTQLRQKARLPFWNSLVDETGIYNETNLGELVGRSEVMRRLFSVILKIAQTDYRVFLLGETGVGKSLIARTIHDNSSRKDQYLAEFTPGEFPETLQESMLFGHVKGAFTGADKDKQGLIAQANKGTLFIDEIGTMALGMQVKLLRFLDTGEYRQLGGENHKADVRLICATNRNIYQMALEGKFQQDLLMRLNVFPLQIPPLRDHKEDIPMLAKIMLSKYSNNVTNYNITDAALNRFMNHTWPGNIRELSNVVERAVFLADFADKTEITPTEVRFDQEMFTTDTTTHINDLVNIDRLYTCIKDKEFHYENMPAMVKTWGEPISREIVLRAIKEADGVKRSGILLNMYQGLTKEESTDDFQKYESYRQYVYNQLKIRSKDFKEG
ncbi:MAG: sigma 54-interacting transcriptional regulator [Thermodesulfobacteriota bacterium]|nr:sigma 54-interacting transcriptional regulator [Thermodesulfobacteriota bacterium]